MQRKKKKKVSVPVLAADPSTFSRHTEKKNNKKKNVRMPGPRCVITFFFFCFFFLILRAQYLVSVNGNTLQGDMVKKSPCGGSLRRRTAELI